ncbi:MAG TPA: DUF6379 domain-containing protein [Anaerolineales bacterium]|nr:DUF6379 domain-containing protein [Anaerolineales bacterium]
MSNDIPRRGIERSFIADEEIRPAVRDGQPGYLIRVRLMSYRSLPLSCIEDIQLSLDGAPVAPERITFVLNGHGHKLGELGKLSRLWWFILDTADLFVASETPLAQGEHAVEGTLVTVEPYVTGGRFSFYYPSSKRLSVAVEA